MPWTNPNEVKRCTSTWGRPLKWQREAEHAGEYKSVFACSYSDFFLPEADGWRDDAWALIRQAFINQRSAQSRSSTADPADMALKMQGKARWG
jgi:hypothetical protein